jgi:hypothetical protein
LNLLHFLKLEKESAVRMIIEMKRSIILQKKIMDIRKMGKNIPFHLAVTLTVHEIGVDFSHLSNL